MAEAKVLNKKLGEEQEIEPLYMYEDRERDIVDEIFRKFRLSADSRNQPFSYFDGRTLIEYVEDNVRRFTTNIDERDELEDWQARVFDPFTRNKVIAILGRVSSALPQAEFIPVGGEDSMRAHILEEFVKYADRVDDNEELMFNALLEAAVKGTVVGYEGYEEKRKKVREVTKYDGADGLSVKDGEKIERRLAGYIIPLEDFYPSTVGVRKIRDMSYCFWRTVMPVDEFYMNFSNYERASLVKPHNSSLNGDEGKPYYKDYISDGLPDGYVEVIRYYNQDTDEFVVMANGIWLNPMTGWVVMPLPFAHKSLPFWSAIYEPFGADFFFGKSMPDKLKSMQDTINVLHNMMLDQSFLSIFPPILTDINDEIEDDFLRPGRRVPVSDQSKYRELKLSTPNDFHRYILEYTKRVLEETSIDSVNQGVAGSGADRTTATEVNRAAQAVASVLGLFVQFIKWGARDKYRLRGKNALQFYTKPLVERILGEGGTEQFNKAFNVFTIDDTVLTSGKRGMRVIEMFSSRDEMPTKMALRAQSKFLEKETGKNVEKIAVNPSYIRDFEFDVKLIPNPQANESKALNRAMLLEYATTVMNLFPDLADRESLFAEVTEAFGYKPERMMSRGQPQAQMMGQGQQGQAPGLGVAENIVNQAMGGREGARSIRDLTSETR